MEERKKNRQHFVEGEKQKAMHRYRKGLLWNKQRKRLIRKLRSEDKPEQTTEEVDRIVKAIDDLCDESSSEGERSPLIKLLHLEEHVLKESNLYRLLDLGVVRKLTRIIQSSQKQPELVEGCLSLLELIFASASSHRATLVLEEEAEDEGKGKEEREKESIVPEPHEVWGRPKKLREERGYHPISKEVLTMLINLLRTEETTPSMLTHVCMALVHLMDQGAALRDVLLEEKLPVLIVIALARHPTPIEAASKDVVNAVVGLLSLVPSLCSPSLPRPPPRSLYPLFPSIPKRITPTEDSQQIILAGCNALAAILRIWDAPKKPLEQEDIRDLGKKVFTSCPDIIPSLLKITHLGNTTGDIAYQLLVYLVHQDQVECKEGVIEAIVDIAGQRDTVVLRDAIATIAPWHNINPSLATKLLESRILNTMLLKQDASVTVQLLHAMILGAYLRTIREFVDPKAVIPFLTSQLKEQSDHDILLALETFERLLQVDMEFKKAADNALPPFTLETESCGGVDEIERLQTHQNESVYEKSVKILETYFTANEEEDSINYVPSSNIQYNPFAF